MVIGKKKNKASPFGVLLGDLLAMLQPTSFKASLKVTH